jgi:hypothetical protein
MLQFLPDQFPPRKGHSFLAAQVASELGNQPGQVDRPRVGGQFFQ